MDNEISKRRLLRLANLYDTYQYKISKLVIELDLRSWWFLSRRFTRFTQKYKNELMLLGAEFAQEKYIWWGYYIKEMNPINCRIEPGYINFNYYKL